MLSKVDRRTLVKLAGWGMTGLRHTASHGVSRRLDPRTQAAVTAAALGPSGVTVVTGLESTAASNAAAVRAGAVRAHVTAASQMRRLSDLGQAKAAA